MAGERTLPGLGLTGFWTAGSDGWKTGLDNDLLTLSAVGQLSVPSRVTALPGSPTDGMIRIVPAPDNRVAVRDAGAWVYLTPVVGWCAWVVDENAMRIWNGSAWVRESQPVDVTGFIAVLTSNAVALKHVFARPVTFADDFAGSVAHATVAPAALTTFNVKKNGATIGTMSFATGSSTAMFVSSGTGAVSFAAGDYVEIVAPSSADASLSGVAITLAGVRV